VGGDFQEVTRSTAGIALCGGCQQAGRCQYGLSSGSLDDEGTAHFTLSCPASHEGGPGVAHGGWTAAVFDEVLGHVPLLLDARSVTGTLTVHYVKPVPLERPLEARAWVDRRDEEKWFVSGELVLGSSGALLATGTAVLIERDPVTHFGSFHAWLAEQ
jgi:acyl-coenzyme A thioesterase PaaI-like protein